MIEPMWFWWGGLAPLLCGALGVLAWRLTQRRHPGAGDPCWAQPWPLLGLAGALVLGYGAVYGWPSWPAADPGQRLLAWALPLAVGVELLNLWLPAKVARPAVRWGLRALVLLALPRLLLHQTVYVSDLAGPNSRLWSFAVLAGWSGVLALAGLLAQASVQQAAQLNRPRSAGWVLGLTLLATGLTIALSSSQTMGQWGLSLAAGLGGAWLVNLRPRKVPHPRPRNGNGNGNENGNAPSQQDEHVASPEAVPAAAPSASASASPTVMLHLAIVLWLALLLLGRFLADVNNLHLTLLLLAPQTLWLLRWRRLQRRPWLGVALVTGATLLPLGFTVVQAVVRFRAAWDAPYAY